MWSLVALVAAVVGVGFLLAAPFRPGARWRTFGAGLLVLAGAAVAAMAGANSRAARDMPVVDSGVAPAAPADEDPAAAESAAPQDAACRADLSCAAERYTFAAQIDCPAKIKRLTPYAIRWTLLGTPLFKRVMFDGPSHGQIRYSGDNLEVQNEHGVWVNHIYSCWYDMEADAVVSVKAWPGRID